jgi:hypothetical protein
MIEPQIHHGQRGVIGEQHGLAKLTSTLDALTKGQQTQQQRDTHLQEQLATVAREQALLLQQMARLARRSTLLGLAVLALMGVLCGLVGWQLTHRPEMAYARALGALDSTLMQQWPQVPKAIQEQLSATYGRLGLVPPSQRK